MAILDTFLGNWRGYLLALAFGLIAGGVTVWKIESWHHAAQQVGQLKQAVRIVERQGRVNVEVGNIVAGNINLIAQNTAKLHEEVPQHVTPQMDAQYPVPVGFVRVWNAASHGPVPGPAAGGDADPSGVPLSDVAHAHVADQGTLDQCRTYLDGWWSWYYRQKAAFEGAK